MMSDRENAARIRAVENLFGASGRSLSIAGRILVGEGHLMKQGRHGAKPKAFFLFNDVLVYGSIILAGSWYKKQKILPLRKNCRYVCCHCLVSPFEILLDDFIFGYGYRKK